MIFGLMVEKLIENLLKKKKRGEDILIESLLNFFCPILLDKFAIFGCPLMFVSIYSSKVFTICSKDFVSYPQI